MPKSAELCAVPPTDEDGGATLLPWLREMRDENPVWRDAYGVWHVFRYADVARVLPDSRVFSSDTARVVPATRKLSVGNLLGTDPPRHHQLRRLVGAAFSPKVVTGLATRIAELTHELLDATGGAGELDLVATLAYPLPVTVIAELLGLPVADRELFQAWADKLLTLDVVDPNDPEIERKVDEASWELLDYLREHCADRRAHPREDLISRLTIVEADGRRLTDEEVVNFSLLLLLAGHVTTTALLGNFVLCIDEHPQVWEELQADRSLVEATIEEVLRYRSPVTRLTRVTMAETRLDGQVIPADALVAPWLLSANRDEREFPDPDRFDIHRFPHHAAFGHGIHFCIGQLLARVEARVAVGVLLDRYARIRVIPGVPVEFFRRGFFAPRNLPVAVRPRTGES
ncbi:MAG: cytochrome P450 [Pseudonocardiales bacterium]|nr:cytochrome P450 [Pseudonocardiales bacterium]MBV9032129.1 cytochrome P450 [Pseudonocardiales bacterium]MBW0009592.1 cytochrome P450 [Pseudonocardiales bacterium]